MNTALARTTLTRFVTNPSATAIALTGPWGSGKTWLWNDIVRKAAAIEPAPFTRYAYVSLFGLNSMAELKAALFENAVMPSRVQQGATPKSLADELKDVFTEDSAIGVAWNLGDFAFWRARRDAKTIASLVPFWGSAVRSAAFLAVRDYVICIDDVERKGKDLSMTDVLGLVSYLREQRNCRVLLILNEEGLGKEGEPERDRFSGFREKVLEREVVFRPTPGECAALVFDHGRDEHRWAAAHAESLGITNMRILQRLVRLMDEFEPVLNEARESVRSSFVHAATMLGWSFYGEAGDAPPYRIVSNVKFGDFVTFGDRPARPTEEQAWFTTLSAYGLRSLDSLDEQICHALERGYMDVDATKAAIHEANERADAEAASGSLTDAWSLFHGSFSDNAAEFTELLAARAAAGARWIRFTEAETIAHVLRRLGGDKLADGFAQAWIDETRRVDPKRLVVTEDHFGTGRADAAFRDAVAAAAMEVEQVPHLGETIAGLVGRNSWSQIDIDVLAAATPDDYLAFFRGDGAGDDLTSYVRTVLHFGNIAGDQEGVYYGIALAASDALRTLAGESAINAMRIGNFNLVAPLAPPAPIAAPANPFVQEG